jgi:hypothetical protein
MAGLMRSVELRTMRTVPLAAATRPTPPKAREADHLQKDGVGVLNIAETT